MTQLRAPSAAMQPSPTSPRTRMSGARPPPTRLCSPARVRRRQRSLPCVYSLTLPPQGSGSFSRSYGSGAGSYGARGASIAEEDDEDLEQDAELLLLLRAEAAAAASAIAQPSSRHILRRFSTASFDDERSEDGREESPGFDHGEEDDAAGMELGEMEGTEGAEGTEGTELATRLGAFSMPLGAAA